MWKCNQPVEEKSLNLNSLIFLLKKGHRGHSIIGRKNRQQRVKAMEMTV